MSEHRHGEPSREWVRSHPLRRPGESLAEHQRQMARWAGCSVEELNRRHDGIHIQLCAAFGLTSQAMRQARGEALTPEEAKLAALEEDAALATQRWLSHARKEVP